MAQLFANNATSTLAADITDTATSLTVGTGAGAEFPNPTAPDYFLVTLESATDVEIVKVTARSGDVMTLVRAQEGTVAAAFATDDLVELRVTAATMTTAMVAPAQIYAGAMREIATVTTSGSQSSVTFSAIPSTYKDLMIVVTGRGTVAATNALSRIRLNGDTGSNYAHLRENRFGSGGSAADTKLDLFLIPGASSLSGYSSTAMVWLRDYASATNIRSLIAQSTIMDGSTMAHQQASGWWLNTTAAVSQVEVYVESGAFVDGSTITLYGIGGEVGGAALNPIYTKYDPFCPPAAPSSLDDEFNVEGSGTGAPPGWTSIGTLTPTWRNRYGSLDLTTTASNDQQAAAIEKALPSGVFSVVLHTTFLGRDAYNSSALYVRSSVSGRIMRIEVGRNTGANTVPPTFAISKWTGISTRSSVSDEGAFQHPFAFLRISYNGTNIYTEWSVDGKFWVKRGYDEAIGTWFTGGNLPDRVGIAVQSLSAYAPPRAAYEFFRYFPTIDPDIGRNIGVGSDGSVVESLPLILHNQVI